jgi:hypothetical protein
LRIASPDQFGSAELAHSFPIFLEHAENISLLKIFESDETLAGFCSETVRKSSCPRNEAIVVEPVESSETFARYAHVLFGNTPAHGQLRKDVIHRSKRQQFPTNRLDFCK